MEFSGVKDGAWLTGKKAKVLFEQFKASAGVECSLQNKAFHKPYKHALFALDLERLSEGHMTYSQRGKGSYNAQVYSARQKLWKAKEKHSV